MTTDNNQLENGINTLNSLKNLNLSFLSINNNPPSFYNRFPPDYKSRRFLTHKNIKDFFPTISKRFKKLARKKFPIKPPKFMKWQEICLNSNIGPQILYDFLISKFLSHKFLNILHLFQFLIFHIKLKSLLKVHKGFLYLLS